MNMKAECNIQLKEYRLIEILAKILGAQAARKSRWNNGIISRVFRVVRRQKDRYKAEYVFVHEYK